MKANHDRNINVKLTMYVVYNSIYRNKTTTYRIFLFSYLYNNLSKYLNFYPQ